MGIVKDVVVIVVNAKTNASIRFDDSPISPNIVEIVETISTVPMQNYSAATVEELFQLINELNSRFRSSEDCEKLISTFCPSASILSELYKSSIHAVHVSFDFVQDEQKKDYLNKIPTSFSLSKEEIDTLRKVGRELLIQSSEFNKFLIKYNEGNL